MRSCTPFALALLGFLALGCGDKAAVTLTVAVQNPTLSVTASTAGASFGSMLGGGIDLVLGLGTEASGAQTITLGTFSAHGSDGTTAIDPLQIDAGTTSFPLTISPGDGKTIHLALSTSQLLSASDRAAFCPGPAQILGSILADGKTNAVTSGPITPTCN